MYEGFAQDQWHITPNMVIEAGLRYSWYNPTLPKWGQSVRHQPNGLQPGPGCHRQPGHRAGHRNTAATTERRCHSRQRLPFRCKQTRQRGHTGQRLRLPVPRVQRPVLADGQDKHPAALRYYLPGASRAWCCARAAAGTCALALQTMSLPAATRPSSLPPLFRWVTWTQFSNEHLGPASAGLPFYFHVQGQ